MHHRHKCLQNLVRRERGRVTVSHLRGLTVKEIDVNRSIVLGQVRGDSSPALYYRDHVILGVSVNDLTSS